MVLRLQPDATTLVVAYLKASTDLQALVSQRVSTDIPAAPVWPRVQVTDVTGRQVVRRQLRETVMDVFSWADSRPVASLVAMTVDAVLAEMSAVTTSPVVTDVRVVTSPVWMPDPDTLRPRYHASYGVIVHP